MNKIICATDSELVEMYDRLNSNQSPEWQDAISQEMYKRGLLI